MIDWSVFTDEEIQREIERGSVVLEQRRAQAYIPEQVEELTRRYLASQGVAPGDPWRQPEAAYDAYPKGWTVTHNGTLWESTVASNVWEPGIGGGWHEAAPEDPNAPAPDWIMPTGAHDAYAKGDIVTYGGRTWRSERGANVWSPGLHGWVIVETSSTPEEPLPDSGTAPVWEAGLDVEVGDQFMYDGKTYTVVQAHTTQVGWEPSNAPSLWTVAA